MTSLETILKKNTRQSSGWRPQIFDLQKVGDRRAVATLFRARKIHQVSDDYDEQLREYFAVTHPTLVYTPDFEKMFQAYRADAAKRAPLWQSGRWVYFPWLCALTHILEEDPYYTVRTARNRNLITAEEQKKFYDAVVGIAGLSVGNSVALTIVLQGGARHIKLADHDRLALSNTNRIRTGVQNLGLAKTEMTAREIYTINPYARVEIFPEGLTRKNIAGFFGGVRPLDVVIDEIDNLAVKHLIREYAQKRRVPLVMAADNGDNVIIDIERYDKNPRTRFFHGRLGNATYEELARLDKFGIGRAITKHLGPENVTPRMLTSLREMGRTLVSWPQLGGAAILNGAAVAYCVRKIVTGQPLEENRALISLDEKLEPDWHASSARRRRAKISADFAKQFNLS